MELSEEDISETETQKTQPVSSTVALGVNKEDNMPPFEAAVDSSGVVKKVTFDDMPLLERQSNETVRYTSPVHPTSKPFLEKEQVVRTKDVKDPSVGAGKAGLFNLGNTCFMNSGLQCVFSNSHLARFFLNEYRLSKANESTLIGAFTRLLYKVWSSKYAIIHPLEFKQTLGLYHPQFQDYRQHDCQEFLALLLDTLHEQLNQTNHSGMTAHFPGATWPTTYDPVTYSASCPSNSPKAESTLQPYPANNKISSATALQSQVQRVCGNINIRSNREAETDLQIARGSIHSIRNIDKPVESKVLSLSPPVLLQSHQTNDDSNLSCQSSDSEHSVGLSRLKLKDQNRETHVSSSTDFIYKSAAETSGNTQSTVGASNVKDSNVSPKENDVSSLMSAISKITQNSSDSEASTSAQLCAAVPLGEKNVEVSSSQGDTHIVSAVTLGGRSITKVDSKMQTPSLESLDSKGCVSVLNNASLRARLPTLEDLYAKDTKTLNTNVLATEYMEEDVQVDSEKFAKPDNTNRSQEALENVHVNELVLTDEQKKDFPRQVKDTNIQAENLKKFQATKNNSPSYEGDSDESLSINNVKRMKFEGTAKNMKRQVLHKVNREKFLFHKSDSGITGSDVDSFSSDEDGRYDNLVEMVEEGQSSVSRDSPIEAPAEIECTTSENITAANQAWEEYLVKNRSVIVDTFQGQFRSTVICSECQHISVTHEPFMYLSVPLPYAMERQISVIYISCDSQPTRYLFTLHKSDNVSKLKKELRILVSLENCDIIIAEVLDSHISRILDDNVMLGYINDTTRLIYAFNVLPAAPLSSGEGDVAMETQDQTKDITALSLSLYSGNVFNSKSTTSTSTYSTSDLQSQDIFSNMDMFTDQLGSSTDRPGTSIDCPTSSTTAFISDLHVPTSCDTTALPVDMTPDLSPKLSLDLPSSSSTYSATLSLDLPPSTVTPSPSLEIEQESMSAAAMLTTTTTTIEYEKAQSSFSSDLAFSLDEPSPNLSRIPAEETPRMNTPELDMTGADSWERSPVAGTSSSVGEFLMGSSWTMDTQIQVPQPEIHRSQQWQSCAICLEEMVDTDLKVHSSCGGTLCQSCLEMSFKHYGDIAFTCPVCTVPVNPIDGFLPLASQGNRHAQTRLLAIPVACRMESDREGEGFKLFSHPNVVYLYSRMNGCDLYYLIDRVLPFNSSYTISLTDGQGLHCSRCVYTAHCTGCLVLRDIETTLQPGDHLTVTISDISPPKTPPVIDHKSMEKLRSRDPITLYDCFTAFTESEILDEHNPWYCPQCCENQMAQKAMTVWRYPDTLIIHLKRFVFHEFSSTKIDNKVVFPVDNLDLSEFLSGPRTKELFYDLHGIVCHFGGANAGHYTAYTKHPLLGQWLYYNDETVSEREPRVDDQSSAYVLFYQRQGTDIKFNPLTELKITEDLDEACSSTMMESQAARDLPESSSSHRMDTSASKTPINAADLASILQNLKEQKEEMQDSSEPDSTFDFYM